jgi:predicted pyridoxine 5'-phosphate oxidase superfamily flavin-nucleotide-binding protein
VIDRIDAHCKAWIERCPFIVVSSINAAGAMDTSPRGDPARFRQGSRRAHAGHPGSAWKSSPDTFLNVLENPSIGIVFIVPKRREVVRVSGTASLARDPDLLAAMTVVGKAPDLAPIVRVREAFFHCGKSVIRSGLWEPDRWGPIEGLATYGRALKDLAALDASLEVLEAGVERNETERLY